jgi:hypothetical protein
MTQPPEKKQIEEKKQAEEAPRRNWAASVGRDAGTLAHAAFIRAGFNDPTLVLRWVEIAGPDVARIARPVRFSARDGLLTLLAEPGAALFLGYESRALAARINAYLGRDVVQKVKFVQGRLSQAPLPPTPRRPVKALNSSDPANGYRGPADLKAALQSLARWRAPDGSQTP